MGGRGAVKWRCAINSFVSEFIPRVDWRQVSGYLASRPWRQSAWAIAAFVVVFVLWVVGATPDELFRAPGWWAYLFADALLLTYVVSTLTGFRPAAVLLTIVIVAMLGFQIGQRWWLPNGSGFNIIHIGLAIPIISLSLITRTKLREVPHWLPPVLVLIMVVAWFWYFYPMSQNYIPGTEETEIRRGLGLFSSLPDKIIGGTMGLWIFYLAWRVFGPIFPAIGLVAVLYGFLASHVPGDFRGPPIPFERVSTRYVLQTQWSGLVGLFASFVWLIIFWGMMLEVAGARRLVTRLAASLGTKFASGPGLVAVGTSGVVGSFTGGGASDVAITGPITIPLMRRAGYTGTEAAAIEASASTAAAVTPPILGAVAFIMADRLGVPYRDILAMTIIPAVLWYAALVAYVVAGAKRRAALGVRPLGEDEAGGGVRLPAMSTYSMVFSGVTILVPLGWLLYKVLNETEIYTATFQSLILLTVLSVVFRAERDWAVWWRGVVRAATFASSVSVTIIVVNIISDTIFFTGLGSRMGDIVYDLSSGRLLIATLLMLIFGIFLSAGMPTLVIYFVMVFTFQPVLAGEFDIPVEATHFVAFYMGALNQLIMPVAASVLVAAGIAGVRYWDAGMEGMKIILPLVLLPFLFVFAPEMLLGVETDDAQPLVLLVASVLVSTVLINMATGGWLGRPLNIPMRIGIIAIAMLVYVGVYRDIDGLVWAGLLGGIGVFIAGMAAGRVWKPPVQAPAGASE